MAMKSGAVMCPASHKGLSVNCFRCAVSDRHTGDASWIGIGVAEPAARAQPTGFITAQPSKQRAQQQLGVDPAGLGSARPVVD